MHPFLVTTAAHYSAKAANKGVAAEVVVSYPTGGELGDPNRPNGGGGQAQSPGAGALTGPALGSGGGLPRGKRCPGELNPC